MESFSDELRKNYPVNIHHLSIDLTKRKSPQKVFQYANNQLTINILVNNAGLGFNGKLEDLNESLIDTMILLNVRASTLLTFLFIPEMKKQVKAYILNISSFAGLSPLPYKSVYAATKTYLLFFTQALNAELKGSGISVTSVHPNGISSERAMENIKKSSFTALLAAMTPAKVAKISLDNMFSENVFVVPGVVNKLYYYIGCSLPHGTILKIIDYIFKKTA